MGVTPRDATRLERRLAHLEREMADAAKLCGMMAKDLKGLRANAELEAQRLMIVVGLVAALLAHADVEPAMLATWVLALAEDDLAEAVAASEAIVQQLALLHGPAMGRG